MKTLVDINGKLFEFLRTDLTEMKAVYSELEPSSLGEPTMRVNLAKSKSAESAENTPE